MTTVIVCIVGLAVLFLGHYLLKNWIAFRRDDKVVINGAVYSFDEAFEDIAQRIGLEGKPRSLIRYSFLKSRPAIAAYREGKGISLKSAVAFYISGSANKYAEELDRASRPLEVDEFIRIAAQAQSFGESFGEQG